MAEKQFTDEELWSSMLDHDLDVTIAPKNSEPAMLIKGKALAEYKNLKAQLAEVNKRVGVLEGLLRQYMRWDRHILGNEHWPDTLKMIADAKAALPGLPAEKEKRNSDG